ncbi:hypothetical protein FNV43_RR15494 [Rhamnella rubrinervis]|uniref:Uncharacterized protein n=1 Tax=Rhamnella rubrinervis TaxID=2594499 RepID=A0A8K0GYB9_9ROSA|nr:hypothetical protein FNV43_RR15494 [Rhamnella rubrinervis]
MWYRPKALRRSSQQLGRGSHFLHCVLNVSMVDECTESNQVLFLGLTLISTSGYVDPHSNNLRRLASINLEDSENKRAVANLVYQGGCTEVAAQQGLWCLVSRAKASAPKSHSATCPRLGLHHWPPTRQAPGAAPCSAPRCGPDTSAQCRGQYRRPAPVPPTRYVRQGPRRGAACQAARQCQRQCRAPKAVPVSAPDASSAAPGNMLEKRILMRRTLVLHEPKWPCAVFRYGPCVLALCRQRVSEKCMSDGSSNNREVYEYGGSDAEYSSDSDGESTQDVNSKDGSTQNVRGDPQGIDGFAIIDIRSSIKTAERLKRFLHPFSMDPSNLRFKEVSSGLYSRIEFAKNQPTTNRSYKNLLRKVDTYLSREALFGEGPSGTSTTHISGSSSHVSDSSLAQLPSIDTSAQTLKGSSSSISVFVSPELSYFAKCSTKILSPETINEMEAISSDMQASLLTTLGAKAAMAQLRSEVIDLRREVMEQRVTISEFEERARRSDADSKLKEDTIQNLQNSLSKSESRIKELESDIIESEETNKKKIKDLEDTMIQLEEKSAKALQELKSLKSSTNETIETKVEVPSEGAGIGDTPARGIDGVEDPAT